MVNEEETKKEKKPFPLEKLLPTRLADYVSLMYDPKTFRDEYDLVGINKRDDNLSITSFLENVPENTEIVVDFTFSYLGNQLNQPNRIYSGTAIVPKKKDKPVKLEI